MAESAPLIRGDKPAAPLPSYGHFEEEEENRRNTRVVTLLVSALVAVGVVAAGARSSGMLAPRASSFASVDDIHVECTNEYTAEHGFAGEDLKWLESGKLVEPHRATTLTLLDVPDAMRSGLRTATWTATHKGLGKAFQGTSSKSAGSDGLSTELRFTDVGQYKLEVTLTLANGAVTTATDTVWCRYVRRNLRKLTDADLSAYLDAALVLYRTTPADGVALYGDDFKDMTTLTRMHREAAVPNKHNDRLHDGMGFLTQHISISNAYEYVLQLVNPSVSLPYWDFTEDWAIYNSSGLGPQSMWEMDIWHEDYFGSSIGSDVHAVTSGRFAYMKVPVDDEASSLTRNAYGTLRSPWNLNPSPYLTRVHQNCGFSILENWPTCQSHYDMVFNSDTLADLVTQSAYVAHAGVHLMVGGSAGCEHWKELSNLTQGMGHIAELAAESSFLLRNMWRYDLCSVPEYCAFDADEDECKMECNGCGDKGFIQDMIVKLNSWDTGFWSHMDAFAKEELTKAVFCSGKKWYIGDQLEASSPADVSFWPIHPTMERLVQYKRLVDDFEDTTWNATGNSFGWNDLCKWGQEFGIDCDGHHEDDLTSFQMCFLGEANVTSFVGGNPATLVTSHLTNSEVLSLSDPDNSVFLPYVYDNFKWPHCDSLGVVFPKASD